MVQKKIAQTETEWKDLLEADVFHILREKGTEPPFSGTLLHNTEKGVYACAGCGNPLFSSETKFDSGSGWPSFWDVVSKDSVVLLPDKSHSIQRIEVQCSRCDGHLGHVFDDGPKPTNKRYCINSLSLNFSKKSEGNS